MKKPKEYLKNKKGDRMIKILGVQTTDDFIYNKVKEWEENYQLPNVHHIDTQSLIDVVGKCIKHDRKFCKKLRENRQKMKKELK